MQIQEYSVVFVQRKAFSQPIGEMVGWLEASVTMRQIEGWACIGGVSCTADFAAQAMVRDRQKTEPPPAPSKKGK